MKYFLTRTAIVLALCLTLAGGEAEAAGPNLLSYQGQVLTSGGAPIANGSYPAIFTFFPVPAGGSPLWSETGSITTTSGLFNHTLGSVTPIPVGLFATNSSVWLDVTVNGQVQIPRTQLTSAGNALAVSTVDGATGGAVTGDVTVTGNVGVGTAAPGAKLEVLNGKIRVSSQVSSTGIEFYPATGGTPTSVGSIDGVGGSTNIAIMPVGNVGVGTTTPTSKLDVAGDLTVSGNIIGSTPWTSFPFAAGFQDYEDGHPGGGAQRVQYRKIGDIVYLRGAAHKTNHTAIPSGTIIGTLPVGFRAPAYLDFSTGNPAVAVFEIRASGDVASYNNVSEYQSLDGISFSTTP